MSNSYSLQRPTTKMISPLKREPFSTPLKLVPPDTKYSAMKMVNAFVTILKTGEESTLALAMSDMATWIKDHEEILEENTRTFDRLLPSKMVYALGDATNNYFKSAKYAVPNQQWLNFDHLKMGLLSNNHSIMLPQLLLNHLPPSAREKKIQRMNQR